MLKQVNIGQLYFTSRLWSHLDWRCPLKKISWRNRNRHNWRLQFHNNNMIITVIIINNWLDDFYIDLIVDFVKNVACIADVYQRFIYLFFIFLNISLHFFKCRLHSSLMETMTSPSDFGTMAIVSITNISTRSPVDLNENSSPINNQVNCIVTWLQLANDIENWWNILRSIISDDKTSSQSSPSIQMATCDMQMRHIVWIEMKSLRNSIRRWIVTWHLRLNIV